MDDIHRTYNLWKKTQPSPRDSEPPMHNDRRVVRSLRERDRRLKRLRIGKKPQDGDSDCFHCGQLFFMHQSRGGRFGLCQPCLGD
ncbi:hypothetical protein ACG873_01365 (plasmid) [Mesorhizobium sp. AaZ16]|uniref:hypothetical protein n=1 Tax=Mesorhizobium sp. AaZ16 TaxID=3402289 RepID=UPI00374EDABE